MKKFCVAALFSVGIRLAQQNVPNQPKVFYVENFSPQGTRTDYDMARQTADAYAATPYSRGSVLILKAGVNETCDAAPLPSLGTSATTSILGSGSGTTRIVKSITCPASSATFSHPDSPNGALSRGWYQGFTVDANHIDAAACELYGMFLTTLLDITCGNAKAGADHEVEVGDANPNDIGWMDNIYIYDLNTFDSLPAGKSSVLTPVWDQT